MFKRNRKSIFGAWYEMLAFAWLGAFNSDAKKLCKFTYPNGNGMSIWEAKEYGLMQEGITLTDEFLECLKEHADNGDVKAAAAYKASKWNRNLQVGREALYLKSEAEGSCLVTIDSPAIVTDTLDVMVHIVGFGTVLIDKLNLKYSCESICNN